MDESLNLYVDPDEDEVFFGPVTEKEEASFKKTKRRERKTMFYLPDNKENQLQSSENVQLNEKKQSGLLRLDCTPGLLTPRSLNLLSHKENGPKLKETNNVPSDGETDALHNTTPTQVEEVNGDENDQKANRDEGTSQHHDSTFSINSDKSCEIEEKSFTTTADESSVDQKKTSVGASPVLATVEVISHSVDGDNKGPDSTSSAFTSGELYLIREENLADTASAEVNLHSEDGESSVHHGTTLNGEEVSNSTLIVASAVSSCLVNFDDVEVTSVSVDEESSVHHDTTFNRHGDQESGSASFTDVSSLNQEESFAKTGLDVTFSKDDKSSFEEEDEVNCTRHDTTPSCGEETPLNGDEQRDNLKRDQLELEMKIRELECSAYDPDDNDFLSMSCVMNESQTAWYGSNVSQLLKDLSGDLLTSSESEDNEEVDSVPKMTFGTSSTPRKHPAMFHTKLMETPLKADCDGGYLSALSEAALAADKGLVSSLLSTNESLEDTFQETTESSNQLVPSITITVPSPNVPNRSPSPVKLPQSVIRPVRLVYNDSQSDVAEEEMEPPSWVMKEGEGSSSSGSYKSCSSTPFVEPTINNIPKSKTKSVKTTLKSSGIKQPITYSHSEVKAKIPAPSQRLPSSVSRIPITPAVPRMPIVKIAKNLFSRMESPAPKNGNKCPKAAINGVNPILHTPAKAHDASVKKMEQKSAIKNATQATAVKKEELLASRNSSEDRKEQTLAKVSRQQFRPVESSGKQALKFSTEKPLGASTPQEKVKQARLGASAEKKVKQTTPVSIDKNVVASTPPEKVRRVIGGSTGKKAVVFTPPERVKKALTGEKVGSTPPEKQVKRIFPTSTGKFAVATTPREKVKHAELATPQEKEVRKVVQPGNSCLSPEKKGDLLQPRSTTKKVQSSACKHSGIPLKK